MTEEIWKKIEFTAAHFVSNKGRIKGPRVITKGSAKRAGKEEYLTVRLTPIGGPSKNFTVHRLVANAFLERDKPGVHVNHKDGDPTNNNVENLEWCTHAENVHHWASRLNGRRKNQAVTPDQVREIKRRVAEGESARQVAFSMNLNVKTTQGVAYDRSRKYIT